jgi:hypothetical protein
MTLRENAAIFKLLDDYARSHHQCFLAEMFPTRRSESQYHLCFRPVGVREDSVARYACRYLTVELAELETSANERKLTDLIAQSLDSEISPLIQGLNKNPPEESH